MSFRGRVVSTADSIGTEKGHLLAFNLAKSVYLPADMEHHVHLTELKVIRSANKSRILAMQKNQITHQCVLELRRTTKAAIADNKTKKAKLKELQTKLADLSTDRNHSAKLLSVAEEDKQKALAERNDRYIRGLAKLEKKKNAKIKALRKQMKDSEEGGFKEGEEVYVKKCQATKDIFFKSGWKATVEKLGHASNLDIFLNPPSHFIPSYMVDYANVVQQKLLVEEDEDSPAPNDTLTDLLVRSERPNQMTQVW